MLRVDHPPMMLLGSLLYRGTTETTSDTETFDSPTFLEPGQSLTWTKPPWGTYTISEFGGQPTQPTGPFTEGVSGAVDASATCQVV